MIRFYNVDPDYIDYLRKHEPQIPYIKYNSREKFVCGKVLNVDGMDYYAPVSSLTDKKQTSFMIKEKDRIISSVRLSFMFPAPPSAVSEIKFKEVAEVDENYVKLLAAEYKYCKKHEDILRSKAEHVYNIGCNKNHALNYVCCDFKCFYRVNYSKSYRTCLSVK